MANDAFLQLAGLSGLATDSAHKDWIEITSFSFNISRPGELSKSDESKEAADLSEVSISKKVDKTSPILAYAACDVAESYSTAKIALCGRCGPKAVTATIGGLPRYMEYKLTDVRIRSYSVSGGSGYATESLSLEFGEIEWIYVGATMGRTTRKWKVTDNAS